MVNESGSFHRPILVRGERYATDVTPPTTGGPRVFPRTYEEARSFLLPELRETRELLNSMTPEVAISGAYIVCLRLGPRFISKSSYPQTLLNQVGWTEVGSRRWLNPSPTLPTQPDYGGQQPEYEGETAGAQQSQIGKTLFVRGSLANLNLLENRLNQREHDLTETWRNDIRKVEALNLQSPDEVVLGFPLDWAEGNADLIVHPFGRYVDAAQKLVGDRLVEHGVAEGSIRYFESESGLTYVNVRIARDLIPALRVLNPLRAIVPVQDISIPVIRGVTQGGGPLPPESGRRPRYYVGMFDGGVNSSNPFLQGYVINSDETTEKRDADGIAHGTAVAGVLLYGPLNSHTPATSLPSPTIGVRSFRVLPTNDFVDLHDVVDVIERIVPTNEALQIYNISLGPSGAIENDIVTRFTEVTDRLSYTYGKLFVVAVGNDGESIGDLGRIQAPSDGVNHLAVGAHVPMVNGTGHERAPYSCHGPGREGAQVKPDLTGFGGSDAIPIRLIGDSAGSTILVNGGTSFATPDVAGKLGTLMAKANPMTPLLAKTLAVHHANDQEIGANFETGWGVFTAEPDEMLACYPNSVTIVCAGELPPSTRVKIPVLIPSLGGITGNVSLKWTACIQAPPDPLHPDDYTAHTVVPRFYPNGKKFRYAPPLDGNGKPTGTPVVLDLRLKSSVAKALELQQRGYKQSTFPVTKSVNSYIGTPTGKLKADWDTVVRKEVSMRTSSLNDPYFTLHAIGRGGEISDALVRYALVVTVCVPKFGGDLQAETLKTWARLEEIRVRSQAEIQIST